MSINVCDLLICPKCKSSLEFIKEREGLACKSCDLLYAIKDNIPVMTIDTAAFLHNGTQSIKKTEYKAWDSNYANYYSSPNIIIRYFFNMRLGGALKITHQYEKRSLSSLTVLEVGCYDGRFSFMLGKYFKSVIGTELNHNHLLGRLAAKSHEYDNVSFCAADVFNLPFEDSLFDIVYGLGVFEHFAQGNKPYEEICRVLKPKGKIVAGLPVETGLSLLVKKVVLDSIGKGRITVDDIYRSFHFGMEHGTEWNKDHRDYNWRRSVEQILQQGLRIIAKKYLPIPWLGALGNPFIVVVAEKT